MDTRIDRSLDRKLDRLADELAKAIVSLPYEDEDLLWHRFREVVVDRLSELREAPVRQALDELQSRGIDLQILARLASERLQAAAEQ
jgi:hypothetical protein